MGTAIMIITILAAILLILIVLVQNPKGGGLDSSFGNVNQLGGVAQSTETIEKATWTLAGVVAVLSLVTAMNLGSSSPDADTNIENVVQPGPQPTSPLNTGPGNPLGNGGEK